MSQIILDVRERDEFDAEHIEHSINVPLSSFASQAPGVLNQLREKDVLILCRSGNRAKLAALEIQKLGYSDKIRAQVYAGGILEWRRQGKPTIQKSKSRIPILRQVQLIAGLIVLSTSLLGLFVDPRFLYVSAFIGAGLMVAGATGFCGMAIILTKMPWNKGVGSATDELCQNRYQNR